MTDYISREYVLKCMEDSFKNAGISAEAKAKMTRWLNKAPTADVREVKRGKWIAHPDKSFRETDVCSACGIGSERRKYGLNPDGSEYVTEWSWDFCPWCGADMREEQT